MPFRMHKIIFFPEKKELKKYVCVPTLHKIFRPVNRNTLFFFFFFAGGGGGGRQRLNQPALPQAKPTGCLFFSEIIELEILKLLTPFI